MSRRLGRVMFFAGLEDVPSNCNLQHAESPEENEEALVFSRLMHPLVYT